MKIVDVKRTNTQGGSIRIHVVKNINNKIKLESNNIKQILNLENKRKLSIIKTYKLFFRDIQKQKNNFLKLLKDKQLVDKTIIGYGASAKATTLLFYYEIPEDIIKIIIDDSKIKENYFMPGYDIQIKSFNFLHKFNFDYIIIFAWNFSEPIIDKLKTIKNNLFLANSIPGRLKVLSVDFSH